MRTWEGMGKFIFYTVAGTLGTFAVILHFSLLPHLMQTPAFASGATLAAIWSELSAFAFTVTLSWVIWWSVSGLLATALCVTGKFTAAALFVLSLGAVSGIVVLIT